MILSLDTNAYVDWRARGGWRHELGLADRIIVTAPVLGELYSGFLGGNRRRENTEKLEQFLGEPQVEIAEVSRRTAQIYGDLFDKLKRAGTPIPTNDIWIAASTIEQGAALLTRDGHFRHLQDLAVCFPEP